jgi:uncharacterized protein (UPF0332 family)
MSFNYKGYFHLAQELIGDKPTEVVDEETKLRSAVSRAYYALFLEARDYLEQHTPLIVPTDGTTHTFVKEQFLARGRTDGKFRQIGMILDSSHAFRKKADYGNNIPNLSQIAKAVILRIEDALKKLAELK